MVASGDAGELTNKLVLTKDAPLGDAFFGVDNSFASRILEAGVLDTSATVSLPEGADQYIIDDTPVRPAPSTSARSAPISTPPGSRITASPRPPPSRI